MGVIRVKLANNYDALPADAATNYAANNRIVKLITPDDLIAGSWEMTTGSNLQDGFGASAQKKSGGYWGFSICFLFNQSTGFTQLYETHLAAQLAAGNISQDYYDWWGAGNTTTFAGWNSNDNRGLASDSATFIHPAHLLVSHLNEISIQDEIDLDFVYPSPIFQDQPNFYLNDTNTGVAIDKRTMQTSQRTPNDVPGLDVLKNEGFGAYGDNPWPKCSMTSFYAAQAFTGESRPEEDIKGAISACKEAQDGEWNTQWTAINGE